MIECASYLLALSIKLPGSIFSSNKDYIMPIAPTPSKDITSVPKLDLEREVRFAIVMYGGVSLAIYINGIAQELLRMVRATAVVERDNQGNELASDWKELNGTEQVYRKLSYLLDNPAKSLEEADADLRSNADVSTRFIVDIISGTSAGGINGIFLGKALANGQVIEALKQLWVTEGDIALLINDKKSLERSLTLQEPPASLLNSQRMYLKLLNALDGMEQKDGDVSPVNSKFKSPYVDELDLFITATDIQGVTLPIRLSDNVVYERRYRNVFHFKFAEGETAQDGRNDFVAEYNPFLAFAARCTSAFPFAFEPMSLCDIDAVVGRKNCQSDSELWQPFFKEYLAPTGVRSVPFPQRAFGDGGYLDNKPFTYATETLSRRGSDVPVDRKLIYIEPSPEHPEDEIERVGKPDALENVMAALLTLPRYETIREDLQRVLEHNRLIQRVNRILKGIETDVERAHLGELAPLSDEEWAKLDLGDMIKRVGRGYVAYHRLEIAVITDELAKLICKLVGFDEESDYLLSIRALIRAWRDRTYVEYKNGEDDSKRAALTRDNPNHPFQSGDKNRESKPTMNQFLLDFDLGFSLRRLIFLRNKIDLFYRFNKEARELLSLRKATFWDGDEPNSEDKRAFRQQLLFIKREMNLLFKRLRAEGRLIQSRHNPANPLLEDIGRLKTAGIDTALLNSILSKRESFEASQDINPAMQAARLEQSDPTQLDEECFIRASKILGENPQMVEALNSIARKLSAHLNSVTKEADDSCLQMLSTDDSLSAPQAAARKSLEHYYRHYDDYDMVSFPILYNTEVGEAEVVQIVRFSPEDAKALIDETSLKCHKLAGTALGHFGAFLDRLWRENDILWGRLDGAERIIMTLLPNHPQTRQLIGEAQAAIVCETIRDLGTEELYDLLVEVLMRTSSGQPDPDALTKFIQTLKREAVTPELKRCLDERINDKAIRDYYRRVFDERSQLSPKPTLRSAARATTVIGKMFGGLADKYERGAKAAAWVARLGTIFWGLVEVAVPRSLPNLLFHYWVKLLYLFDALLIIVGPFLGGKEVQTFGWKALGITLIIHAVVLMMTDLMRGKIKRWRKTKYVIVAAVVVLTLLGILFFRVLFKDPCHFLDDVWPGSCAWVSRYL